MVNTVRHIKRHETNKKEQNGVLNRSISIATLNVKVLSIPIKIFQAGLFKKN